MICFHNGATLIRIICSLNADGIRYYKPSVYRLTGEWILVNCEDGDDISLVFNGTGSKLIKDLPVDHNKIKLVALNVFNVTNLTNNDTGEYACNMVSKGVIGDVYIDKMTRQNLIVLNEGKT